MSDDPHQDINSELSQSCDIPISPTPLSAPVEPMNEKDQDLAARRDERDSSEVQPPHPSAGDASTLAVRDCGDAALIDNLAELIYWLLGERGSFPPKPEPLNDRWQRNYWWRRELRQRFDAIMSVSPTATGHLPRRFVALDPVAGTSPDGLRAQEDLESLTAECSRLREQVVHLETAADVGECDFCEQAEAELSRLRALLAKVTASEDKYREAAAWMHNGLVGANNAGAFNAKLAERGTRLFDEAEAESGRVDGEDRTYVLSFKDRAENAETALAQVTQERDEALKETK